MNCVIGLLLFLTSSALCLLNVELNGACKEAADCAIAYSTCTSKKCTCVKGFTAEKGLCKPPAKQCPTWECPRDAPCTPPSKPGKDCEMRMRSDGTTHDTCDQDKEFCHYYLNTQSEVGASMGHCCTKPPDLVRNMVQMKCPFDINDPKGFCPSWEDLPRDMPPPKDKQRTCSYITHDCVMLKDIDSTACCPEPCHGAASHFNVKGRCYDTARIGENCTHPAQCQGESSCVPNTSGKGGTCRCRGKVLQEPYEHCENPF